MKIYFLMICSTLLFFSVFDSFADDTNKILELENKSIQHIEEIDYENAIKYLDRILEIEPNNINALNNKGGILIKQGNYSGAIAYFDLILVDNEKNTEVLNNKAIALFNQEKYVQSLRTFYKSLMLDPFNQKTVDNTHKVIDELYFLDETKNGYALITVRDKDGNLQSVSKAYQISLQPPLGYIFLELEGVKKEVNINGNNVTMLHVKEQMTLDANQFVGRTDLSIKINQHEFKAIELLLNGFIARAGDIVEYEIVIFNPQF